MYNAEKEKPGGSSYLHVNMKEDSPHYDIQFWNRKDFDDHIQLLEDYCYNFDRD